MFECHACVRRAWAALLHDVTPRSGLTSLSPARSNSPRYSPRRWHSVSAYAYPKTAEKTEENSNRATKTVRLIASHAGGRSEGKRVSKEKNDARFENTRLVKLRRPKPKEESGKGKESTELAESGSEKRALTRADMRRMDHTLQFLVDPRKFASHIDELLIQKNGVDAALTLVRYASKTRNCVVAWNHIVKWHLENDKPNAALKLYNEMKKRDQWPDSFTYKHLLLGLCSYWQYPTMLAKALSIYHSMSAENSRVTPGTIHANMALKMCSRAGDMDALWGVVSRLPETGLRSADNITYSIILNAIRRAALESMDVNEADEGELIQHFDKAVMDGCRVWHEVNTRWRKGELKMDDALVCAMGRVLLLSYRPKAWDAVFSLVEGTSSIPRVSPVIKDNLTGHLPALKSASDSGPYSSRQDTLQPVAGYSGEAEQSTHLDQYRNMVTVAPAGGHLNRNDLNLVCVRPTNWTLSLLIETCQKLRNKRAGDLYWQKLTNPAGFDLVPDSDNFHTYLRLLRQFHSGTQSLRLISREMSPKLMEFKTFRIAMSACTKGLPSAESIEDCAKLVDIMVKRLSRPDIPTLTAYLQFAKSSKGSAAIIQAVKHIDLVIHNPTARVIPNDIEEIQKIPPARKKELLDLTQCLRDCIALAEKDRSDSLKNDLTWAKLHKRVMKSSSFFLQVKLSIPESEDKNERPAVGTRGNARINARSVRRLVLPKPEIDSSDSGLAELPFEMDKMEARA